MILDGGRLVHDGKRGMPIEYLGEHTKRAHSI